MGGRWFFGENKVKREKDDKRRTSQMKRKYANYLENTLHNSERTKRKSTLIY